MEGVYRLVRFNNFCVIWVCISGFFIICINRVIVENKVLCLLYAFLMSSFTVSSLCLVLYVFLISFDKWSTPTLLLLKALTSISQRGVLCECQALHRLGSLAWARNADALKFIFHVFRLPPAALVF